MESSSDLYSQAATLMIVGMGFVFAFLSLLIMVIKTVIAPLATRFPDPVAKPRNTGNRAKASSTDETNRDSVVAAISAAVSQYRKDQK